ncbi:MAG: hypothetical protein R6U91_03880 [Bacillota bacterium]
MKQGKQYKMGGIGSCSTDFVIRVEKTEDLTVIGKVEHVPSGQIQYFGDFLELIMLMQGKLDEQDKPQCETELRTFLGD